MWAGFEGEGRGEVVSVFMVRLEGWGGGFWRGLGLEAPGAHWLEASETHRLEAGVTG